MNGYLKISEVSENGGLKNAESILYVLKDKLKVLSSFVTLGLFQKDQRNQKIFFFNQYLS